MEKDLSKQLSDLNADFNQLPEKDQKAVLDALGITKLMNEKASTKKIQLSKWRKIINFFK